MTYTIHLKQTLPFATNVPFVELDDERILCNDVVLPGENHCYNMRLWVLGNEYGPMGAVWASNEQDALDELIDADLGNGILIDEADADEDTERAGNAGEPIDTDYLWMAEVSWDVARDYKLLFKLAEARGANANTASL